MPRSFCLERDPDSKSSGSIRSSHPESRPLDGIRSSHPDSNPFDNTRRTQPPSKEQMTNQELVQHNQKLQTRVQKLTTAYQAVEQQNVMLRDRCLRLQNRVDELKEHLAAIKGDVGQRVAPMRLVAGHLYEVATFLETLDQSIDTGICQTFTGTSAPWNVPCDRATDLRRSNLEVISESVEGTVIAVSQLSHDRS